MLVNSELRKRRDQLYWRVLMVLVVGLLPSKLSENSIDDTDLQKQHLSRLMKK